MCTAISAKANEHYFGRNLDYEHSFGEKITITPRNFCFSFRNGKKLNKHYAMIGMALPFQNYPLYFDATNEKGLSIAGLNFPGNAKYFDAMEGKKNVASFELVPWLLAQCETVREAEKLLSCINITDEEFCDELKSSPLHWMVADSDRAITVEQTEGGLKVHENPTGVLANNPPFPVQSFLLNQYLSVSPDEPENAFSKALDLKPYSRGMGGIGLPGDLSSVSRFVKTCFLTLNAKWSGKEIEAVNQFFHLLYSVYQIKGAVRVGNDFEITHYTSCCNTKKGIYYYTTYENNTIHAVDMFLEDLNGDGLIVYDLIRHQTIDVQNKEL